MPVSPHTLCTAFQGDRRIASGELANVALHAKGAVDGGAGVLLFDDATSHTIELDFRGTADDVLRRLTAMAPEAPPPATALPEAPPAAPDAPGSAWSLAR